MLSSVCTIRCSIAARTRLALREWQLKGRRKRPSKSIVQVERQLQPQKSSGPCRFFVGTGIECHRVETQDLVNLGRAPRIFFLSLCTCSDAHSRSGRPCQQSDAILIQQTQFQNIFFKTQTRLMYVLYGYDNIYFVPYTVCGKYGKPFKTVYLDC